MSNRIEWKDDGRTLSADVTECSCVHLTRIENAEIPDGKVMYVGAFEFDGQPTLKFDITAPGVDAVKRAVTAEINRQVHALVTRLTAAMDAAGQECDADVDSVIMSMYRDGDVRNGRMLREGRNARVIELTRKDGVKDVLRAACPGEAVQLLGGWAKHRAEEAEGAAKADGD